MRSRAFDSACPQCGHDNTMQGFGGARVDWIFSAATPTVGRDSP